MTDDDLKAIEARDAARTPGEWTWEDDSCLQPGMATLYAGRDQRHHGLNLFGRLSPDANGAANLDWIAACSVDVPRLCAALREAQTALARVTAERDALAERLRLLEPADY